MLARQTQIVGLGVSSSLGPNLEIFTENLAKNERFFECDEMMIGYDGREQIMALRYPYPAERDPILRLKALFDEAFEGLVENAPEDFFEWPVHALLALPNWVGGDSEMVEGLRKVFFHDFPLGIENMHVEFEAHVGADKALALAHQKLFSGQMRRAVVFAVDTHATPKVLDDPFYIERVIVNDNPYGFIPGEAGVAVALDQVPTTEASWGQLLKVDQEQEKERPGDLEGAIMGFGMRALFRRAHEAVPNGKSFDLVAGDMNGQRYRAEEYGFSVTGQVAPSDAFMLPFLHSLNVGDVGAASGLMSLLCTIISNVVEGSAILTWASAEQSGLRTAKILIRGPRQLEGRELDLEHLDEGEDDEDEDEGEDESSP